MSGLNVSRDTSKNPALYDKYQCPYCNHLLKDAMQAECGHWLCECCADKLLAGSSPKCPKLDCQEFLKSDEEGAECFPDRFVRKEIKGMIVSCPQGCQWEDRLEKLETHLKSCSLLSDECNLCGVILSPDQIESHGQVCPKALIKCPLVKLGCTLTRTVTREEVLKHLLDHGLEHLQSVVDAIKQLQCPGESNLESLLEVDEELDFFAQQETSPPKKAAYKEPDGDEESSPIRKLSDEGKLFHIAQTKVAGEVESQLRTKMLEKDKEKKTKLKEADHLSLLKMSMGDVWKITKFSQKRKEALIRMCPPFFSLPFSPGQYKMCLRLDILADDNEENTHISLSFVIMKGDRDDMLQWPFTTNVTVTLINQTGGRDIIKTFQPDPNHMSVSLQKPKGDMNIASGCLLFVPCSQLDADGFIVEDTICIKCCVSPPEQTEE